MAQPAASVVLATFNQPRLLELALAGYVRQRARDFELVIADDGSGDETRRVIERWRGRLEVPLTHVWQPDDGFRKARALNGAVLETRGARLVFSDGDCVPHPDFVASHLRAARPRSFAVGGHVRLSQTETSALDVTAVASGALDRAGTRAERAGLWWTHAKSLAYIALGMRRRPRLYGLNFSVDRDSFFALNGFDQTYCDSAKDDSDLRNRMLLAGLLPVSLWHRARVAHLHHPPHVRRTGWSGARAYYSRPDLSAVAPAGLRELAGERSAGSLAAGR